MVFILPRWYNQSHVASSRKSFSDKQDRGFHEQKWYLPVDIRLSIDALNFGEKSYEKCVILEHGGNSVC